MKLNEIKCPNCMGSDVEAVGEGLMKCRYCQTTFAIDYDEEDAAMDKSRIELQMQREKFEHQDKIRKDAKKSRLIACFTLLIVIFVIVAAYIINSKEEQENQEDSASFEESKVASITYVSDFSEIPDDQFDEMQNLAMNAAQEGIDISTINGLTADIPELCASYLLTAKEGVSNRLVFVYKDTWHKNSDSIETYVFYYIKDLQLLSDGTVKYNVYVQNENSSFIWNNNFIDGEKSFDLCYTKAISSNADFNVKEK